MPSHAAMIAAGTGATSNPQNDSNFRNPKENGSRNGKQQDNDRPAQAPCPGGFHHPHAAAQPDTTEHIGVFLLLQTPPEPSTAPQGLHGASVRPTDLSRGNRASSPLWKSVLFSSLARMSILFISISSMSLIRRSTPRDSSAPITAGTQRASETPSRAGRCRVRPRKSPSPRLQPQSCLRSHTPQAH